MSNFIETPPVSWDRGRVLEWLNGEFIRVERVGNGCLWFTATAPTSYLICDGSSLDTTVYAKLFAVIGTTYGGSGTNFNLPDLRQRFPFGVLSSDPALASWGGAYNHTHTTGDWALTEAQLRAHTHGVPGGHTGFVTYNAAGGPSGLTGPGPNIDFAQTATGSTGSSAVHNHGATGSKNPPYLAVNFIIRFE